MNDEVLQGRLAALEYLLGQLFVFAIETNEDPQAWIRENVKDFCEKAGNSTILSELARIEAKLTAFRVMSTAARSLEASGRGPGFG